MTGTRTTIAIGAALLCLFSGQLLFALHPSLLADVMLPLGVGLHVAGLALGWHGFRQEICDRDGQPPRHLQWIALGGVAVLAAALRLLWLDTVPFRVDGDAAAFASSAANFLKPEPPPLIGTGWQSHTNLYFFFESLALRLFGRSALGLRFLGAIGGTLSILAIYALGRSLWDFWTGFWAALIVAALPFHLVFSRVGTEVIHMAWLLPLAIWAVWRGWQRNAWRWLLLGGAITGLSQYFYPGARLIPILVVAQIGLLTLFPPDGARSWRRGGAALLWIGAGVLLVYGPMIAYFAKRPEIYTARVSIVNIFSSGWLDHELARHPWWLVLGDQLRRAYLPFLFPIGGPPLWYVWPQYLGPFDAALFALGLIGVWAARDTARWLKLFLACYLGVGILLGGVLTIDTPMPSRYITFVPAVALCMGYALDRLIRQFRAPLPRPQRKLELVFAAGAACLYVGGGIYSYLQHDTRAMWDSDYTGQTATYAARYLQALPEQDFEIVFLETDWIYYEASPVLKFLTDKPGRNIEEELSCETLTDTVRQPYTVLLAPEDRLEELRQLHKRLTSSELVVLHNPKGKQIIGMLHVRIPPNNAPLCVSDR
ncbi:MAG TPA: glycosyltransferase family 39 protein [Herpetosiphonaceae bacterium]